MARLTVQVRQKGTITLPKEIRQRYQVTQGDIFTLVDLGDGSFLLTPTLTPFMSELDEVARKVEAEGVSLEELLEALDQEREAYYQERYG